MKKSDAVKLIEEVIHDTYDYDPDLGWTVDAEAVLDALLKEGMLPPERPLGYKESESLRTTLRPTEVFLHYHKWDSEND